MKHFHWTYVNADGSLFRDAQAYVSERSAMAAAEIDQFITTHDETKYGHVTCSDPQCPGLRAESAA